MSEQFRKNIRQLRHLDFDLANYFSNTIIPQLFVDGDLVLRIFTPPAMEQFSLSYADIGKHIEDVKDNIRYPTIVENIREVISTGQAFEKEIQTTDGNWFQMNIVPYVEHELDNINGIIMTFVNITKRVATLKELEKINAEHQVLMFALNHDMKQPIFTLKLLSTGLRETYQRQNKEAFLHMIERLETTFDGLSTLVDEFTSNGDLKVQNKEEESQLDITVVVRDVLEALREEIYGSNITIHKDFKTSTIVFPQKNLRSIVYNLLHNAIKYRNRHRASVILISTYQVEDFVVLSVEDNGIGVAEEHQETIFEKSARISKDIEGTGKGLYIIKKMVEANEGKIELKSNLGQGSRFQIFFKDEPGVNRGL